MARVDFFRRVPLLANLSETELEALARDFSQRQFRQGETIFQQGDSGQMLYLIESGQVRIYVQSEEGQETSVIVYGPGDLFGELSVIDEGPRSASAIAMEDTIVHLLSRDRFANMRRSSQLALDFLKY
jgi:CRP/FNR family transcriptional regulator